MSRQDFIAQHLARALDHGSALWREATRDFIEKQIRKLRLESPLEAAFWVWWQIASDAYGFQDLHLEPQYECQVGARRYRLDFAIVEQASQGRAVVAVELDGHEFHERTKKQVAYRNERDRALQSAGWLVLHYSGSEFHRDPDECVSDAYYKSLFFLMDRDAVETRSA